MNNLSGIVHKDQKLGSRVSKLFGHEVRHVLLFGTRLNSSIVFKTTSSCINFVRCDMVFSQNRVYRCDVKSQMLSEIESS